MTTSGELCVLVRSIDLMPSTIGTAKAATISATESPGVPKHWRPLRCNLESCVETAIQVLSKEHDCCLACRRRGLFLGADKRRDLRPGH